MKVLIDVLPHKTGGGLTYVENLIPELAELSKDNEYDILILKNLEIGLDLPENCHINPIFIPAHNVLFRIFYEQIILPMRLLVKKFDLLFSPAESTVLLSPVPSVLAIRNPNPYFGQFVGKNGKWGIMKNIRVRVLKILTKISSMKSSKVIFVSDYSRKGITKQLRIPPKKTITIYHGINKSDFNNCKSKALPEDFERQLYRENKYILTVSSIYSFKNYTVLLKAYNCLEENLKDKYSLVIAGKIVEPNYYKSLHTLSKELGINGKIHFLGEIKHDLIPSLYSRATLFVLPSFLETFGHTLLEAMASSLPIIAAESTAIPEILGGAGLLFDPNNPEELAEKIIMVLKDKGLREELIRKGLERVKQFSWEKTARETLQVFESVYNKR